ncbi:MAG: hypothetical protein GC155_08380 [Alphaproteobacteria bacterium]|nr:hypothetical protein [Alphaproteobacteria bacterium]
MTTPSRSSDDIRAVDVEIGDNDLPGLALELTTDDIDDIAMDAAVPLAERRWKLIQLRDELAARRSGDFMNDMEELSDHIADRLAALGNPLETGAELGSTGMNADDRSDDDDPADHLDDDVSEDD